jgi:hypothetical protein
MSPVSENKPTMLTTSAGNRWDRRETPASLLDGVLTKA